MNRICSLLNVVSQRCRARAFTLAALLVVIALTGILMAIDSAGAAEAAGKASEIRTAAPKPAPGLKGSRVAVWFDEPEDHQKYDVDFIMQDMNIVDELEVPKWKELIGQLHAKGKLFWAELRPLTHVGNMFEYVMNDRGLQDALCLDFNLNPIKISWMANRTYKGSPIYLYCSNHPHYRAFLRHQVFMMAEAGVDGIHVDDGGGSPIALGRGGCCCPYCMAGFREYLRGQYTAEQLKARGIADLDKFDYRQVLLKHADDQASFATAMRLHEIPLSDDFRDFLRRSDVELFQSLQQMASKLSGRHIPMGWDNVDLGARYAPYYRFLDVFAPETNHQKFAVSGRGEAEKFLPGIIVLDKLSDALGKWHTPTPAPDSWGAIKRGNLTGMLRLWVSFSYANGGLPRYPRKGWCFGESSRWYYPPKEEFEPIYDFVRTHPELLNGYEAVQQVGVLYAERAGDPAGKACASLRHVCESLVNRNVPFGVVVAGDNWLAQRVTPEDAKRFELLLVPEPLKLDAAQQQVVDGWKSRQAAISVGPTDDVGRVIAGRVDPLVALESRSSVWLFPRAIPGKKGSPMVCHLLNWDYDAQKNRATPQKDVKVRLRSALAGGFRVTKVTYHTVGKTPQALQFALREDGIHVVVPELQLWGILELDTEDAPAPGEPFAMTGIRKPSGASIGPGSHHSAKPGDGGS